MKIDYLTSVAGLILGVCFGVLIEHHRTLDQRFLAMAYPLALRNRVGTDLRTLLEINSNHVDVATSLLKNDLKDNITSLEALTTKRELTATEKADLDLAKTLLSQR